MSSGVLGAGPRQADVVGESMSVKAQDACPTRRPDESAARLCIFPPFLSQRPGISACTISVHGSCAPSLGHMLCGG